MCAAHRTAVNGGQIRAKSVIAALAAEADMRPFNELQIPHARHAGCPDGRRT
jgi:hypothetical protein